MNKDEGLSFVLSPVQLAAIVRYETVSEGEVLSNRLWGGLSVVGSVAEIFGAGILCIVPEPTMITKAGCIVVGAHSLDALNASLRQFWSGRRSETATSRLAEMAAEQLGADSATAYRVGITVDLTVPFIFASAAGVARIASVYSGRIRLKEHEGGRLGHTIARHVGRTPEQLIARLSEPRAPHISASFKNIRQAELIISEVLSVKSRQIEYALKYTHTRATLVYVHRFNFPIGTYVERGATEVKKAYGVRLVIRPATFNGRQYYLVTAFPTP